MIKAAAVPAAAGVAALVPPWAAVSISLDIPPWAADLLGAGGSAAAVLAVGFLLYHLTRGVMTSARSNQVASQFMYGQTQRVSDLEQHLWEVQERCRELHTQVGDMKIAQNALMEHVYYLQSKLDEAGIAYMQADRIPGMENLEAFADLPGRIGSGGDDDQ